MRAAKYKTNGAALLEQAVVAASPRFNTCAPVTTREVQLYQSLVESGTHSKYKVRQLKSSDAVQDHGPAYWHKDLRIFVCCNLVLVPISIIAPTNRY